MVQRGEGVRFHRPEDGSADVFVHYTEIQGSGFRTLEENQKVEFEVGQSPRGRKLRVCAPSSTASLTKHPADPRNGPAGVFSYTVALVTPAAGHPAAGAPLAYCRAVSQLSFFSAEAVPPPSPT